MNAGIGTVATQFLFWENMFRIFGVVSLQCVLKSYENKALIVCQLKEAKGSRDIGMKVYCNYESIRMRALPKRSCDLKAMKLARQTPL